MNVSLYINSLTEWICNSSQLKAPFDVDFLELNLKGGEDVHVLGGGECEEEVRVCMALA